MLSLACFASFFLYFFLTFFFLYRKSSMRSYCCCVRIWACVCVCVFVKPSNYNKKINCLKYFKYSVSFFIFFCLFLYWHYVCFCNDCVEFWFFLLYFFFFSGFFVYKHPLIVTLAFMTPAHTGHLLKFVESEKFHRTSIGNK